MNSPQFDFFQASASRRRWLLGMGAAAALGTLQSLASQVQAQTARTAAPARRMPVIFIGHGSPMNAISDTLLHPPAGAVGAGIATPGRHPECVGALADTRHHGG